MPQIAAQSATTILAGVVRTLVNAPDRVQVEAAISPSAVLITLSVSPADLETVVGPDGRTSRSLRTIAVALGRRTGVPIQLDIKPQSL